MNRFLTVLVVLVAGQVGWQSAHSLAATVIGHQEALVTETVIGEVIALDTGAGIATVRTDQGGVFIFKVADNATCLRIPVGDTTLANAVAIRFADIRVADRVLGQGLLGEDKKELSADRLIVVSKIDIEKKRERDLAEWQKRGIAGVVKALNSRTREISLETHGVRGVSRTVITTEQCEFRRYAPASADFADATPGEFAELRVGDHLRALGDLSADRATFKAKQIVSGSFRIVRCVVTSVASASNEIEGLTLDGRKPIKVEIGRGSSVCRIPPELAASIRKTATSMRSAGTPSSPAEPRAGLMTAQGQARRGTAGTGAANELPDVQQIVNRLPGLALTSLKQGDVIAVIGTVEREDSMVAIKVIAGIEALLNASKAPSGKQQTIALTAGLPQGAFEFNLRLP